MRNAMFLTVAATAIVAGCSYTKPAIYSEAECRKILGSSYDIVSSDPDYNNFNCRIQRDRNPEPVVEEVVEPVVEEVVEERPTLDESEISFN